MKTFARALPKGRRHAIEFCDPSWYRDDIFAVLDRHRIALCLHDMSGSATGRLEIGPFVYVRFHGPRKYSGRYDERTLDSWAEWLSGQRRAGRPVFAYFNNESGGHAPRDADRLRRALLRPL